MKKREKALPAGSWFTVITNSDQWRNILPGDVGMVIEVVDSTYSSDLVVVRFLKDWDSRTYRIHSRDIRLISNKQRYNGDNSF